MYQYRCRPAIPATDVPLVLIGQIEGVLAVRSRLLRRSRLLSV
jgi:hypothetical protein